MIKLHIFGIRMREGRILKFVLHVTMLFNLMSCGLVLFLGRTFQSSFLTCQATAGKEQDITTLILDSSRTSIHKSCWLRSGYDENLNVMSFFVLVFVALVVGTQFIWNNLSRVSAVDDNIKHKEKQRERTASLDTNRDTTLTEVLMQAVASINQDKVTSTGDVGHSPEVFSFKPLMKVFIYYLLKTVIQVVFAYVFTLNTFWSDWGWQNLWLGKRKWCWIPRAVTKLGLECHPTPLGRTIGFLMVTDGVLSLWLCVSLGTYLLYLPVMLYAKISTVQEDLKKFGITAKWKIFALLFYLWLGVTSDEITECTFSGVSTDLPRNGVPVSLVKEKMENLEAEETDSKQKNYMHKISVLEGNIETAELPTT